MTYEQESARDRRILFILVGPLMLAGLIVAYGMLGRAVYLTVTGGWKQSISRECK